MLKIAFRRIGRKKVPIYQIVVQDKKKTRQRNFIAKLGIYMPLKNYISLDVTQITY
jgi:ribosomal protein S16